MTTKPVPDDALPAYLLSAVRDVVATAKACDTAAAQSELSDQVLDLFNASSELCRAMRHAAWGNERSAYPEAGIVDPPNLC